ncbi:hypothetical protein ACF08M_30815 [Streptomyces sp. NPDC015032]|uniref:hypothetical protein n=1 Tax=Streptomyces sp. NPDC015032 TaxID=3364937 RepID=UPI0037004406
MPAAGVTRPTTRQGWKRLSEEFAAVGWPDGTWGFAADSGKTVWDSTRPGCGYDEYLGGKTLVGLTYCADRFEVAQRDPRTGKPSRIAKLPTKVGWAWIASSDPLVVAAYEGKERISLDANRLYTFDESGAIKTMIKVDGYVPDCEDNGGAVVATNNTVYLASKRENLISGDHIAAFDADTGRRKWTVDGIDGAEMLPLHTDEDGLIAYSDAGPTKDGSGVLHLAATDGRQNLLLRLPNGFAVSDVQSQMATRGKKPIVYQDGRLFFHVTSGFRISSKLPMNLAFTTH